MESFWVQQPGQNAEEHRLRSGSALEDLMSSLGCPHRVVFQRQAGNYASYPRSFPVDDLRTECARDGRSAETAMQIRIEHLQGPVCPSM